MSLVQTGNPSDVTTPLSATVTALTSSSGLVEVTTSTPHLFGNGDTVQMFVSAGVGWGSLWSITVIDSTHFTLTGSTFSSTGTGTVEDIALTPQILTPTDGDAFSLQLSGLLSSQRGILSRTQYLNKQIYALNEAVETGAFPARNWHGIMNFAPSGITNGPCGIIWNDTPLSIGGTSAQLWLFAAYNGGSSLWELYVGDGSDALQGPFPSAGVASLQVPTDVLVNPTNGDVYVATYGAASGPTTENIWRAAGGTLTSFTQIINASVTNPSDAKLAYVTGQIVTAVGSTTASDAYLATVTTTGGLTNILASLTATTWILVGDTGNGYLNGAALAIAAQASSAPNIYKSTNGTSWAAASLSGVLASTEIPVGLCYLLTTGFWYMAVQVSSTSFRIMSSPDGVTWNKIGGTHTTGTVTSISFSGNYLVATLYRGTLFSGDPSWQMIYSFDGVTWYGTNSYLLQGALVTPRLSPSPTQLCAFGLDTPAGGGTLNYRFSDEGGNDANGQVT